MNNYKKILVGIFIFSSIGLQAQTLSLESCKSKARSNFPLLKQIGIIENLKDISLENLSKGYLPQINFNAQGTYQSEVTAVPISLPNLTIKSLDKDQYKTYIELYQPLLDGQQVKKQQALSTSQFAVEKQKVEVELFKLNASVNQLYFGILLLDSQLKSSQSLLGELENNLQKLKIGVKEGIINPLNQEVFEAEKIKIVQRLEELQFARKSLAATLSILIAEPIADGCVFEIPKQVQLPSANKRPELGLFDLQIGTLEQQQLLLKNKLSPRLGIIGQIGYGRPALNMLNNDFKEYYIGGLKLSWSISSFYTNAKERKSIDIQKDIIASQRDVFNQQTSINQTQIQQEIAKWEALISTDGRLVETRKRILKVAEVQFAQGTLSSLDYLAYLNQLEQAEQQMQLHQLQKLQSVYQQQYILGNESI